MPSVEKTTVDSKDPEFSVQLKFRFVILLMTLLTQFTQRKYYTIRDLKLPLLIRCWQY